MSIADDLERLGELKARGVLTEDEFDAAKKRLLATGGSDEAVHPPDEVPVAPDRDPPSDDTMEASGSSSAIWIGLGLVVLVVMVTFAALGDRSSPAEEPPLADSLVVDAMMEDTTLMMELPSSTGWMVSTDVSEIDDSRSVFVQLSATTPVYYSYGRSHVPMLTLRCSEGTTAAYIDWGEFLGSDDLPVEVRVDSSAARERRWDISSDNQAAGLWYGGTAIPFIQSLIDSNKLVVRLTPYSESPVTATFVTTGFRQHASQLAQACGWEVAAASG
jgi:type VI secretion system protein VasI